MENPQVESVEKVKLLSASDILNIDDTRTEIVSVPEWGGSVLVKSLTGQQRDKFEASMIEQRRGTSERKLNIDNARARFCSLVMVDENHNLLFKPGDVTALGNKSANALERVYEIGLRLSGMTPDDMEELEGNSESEV